MDEVLDATTAPGTDTTDKVAEAPERFLIDGSNVIVMMTVEGNRAIPVPITSIFQQLFTILNNIDQRLIALEEKLKVNPEGESRILTFN